MHGLKARHIEVSQSTLSRDIQELRLAKTGGVYTVVERNLPQTAVGRILAADHSRIPGRCSRAQNIVVVKTGPGHASTVSQAMDEAGWPEAIGTIAGENTVFIAVRSEKDGKETRASDTRVTVAVTLIGHSSSSCRIGFAAQRIDKVRRNFGKRRENKSTRGEPGCGIVRPGCWTILFP